MRAERLAIQGDTEEVLFGHLAEDLTGFEEIPAEIISRNLSFLKDNHEQVGDIGAVLRLYSERTLSPSRRDPGQVGGGSFCDSRVSHTVAQIIYLFYLGAIRAGNRWRRAGWAQHSEALVWKALQVHAPMARGAGEYGDWAIPPRLGPVAGYSRETKQ